MANEIKGMLNAVKGVKKDWKEDFKETSKADWKLDFDAVPGVAPGVTPANTVLPAITGTAEVGETLTVSNGTWTGNPTPTFTYQWTLEGTNIVGATANTYVVDADDAELDVACKVTGTNVVGAVTVTAVAVTIAAEV